MRKIIIATIATIMFVTASPAVAFAHGGNSGPGSGHDMRFDDHRFKDHDRFKRDRFRDFRADIRNNVSIFNKIINSDNARINNRIIIRNIFRR